MITEEQAERANDFIRDKAAEYAQAKANRVYLDEYRKTKKALLFQQAPDGTVQAKESYAYGHEEYQQVLDGLREAVEAEETLKWQMVAAQEKIDIWRSQEASSRKGV